ncbi:hypothetical protein D770_16270 [Flammeovirgaceae bacterium 311]|nr:hypothetical protein D770_16270 [Flammeovirgaceae bacterium 311]
MNVVLFVCTLAMGISCVDPYEPPVVAEANNYLVVEGVLRSGAPSHIRLTRTARLADTASIMTETAAVLAVESEGGSIFHLQESENGTYALEAIDLSPQDRYRLRIKTRDSKEYLSDYVEVKQSPPIDSLSWTMNSSGVQLFVTTHDPQDNTRFYRWEFEETWEFRSPYQSTVQYIDGQIVDRIPPTPTRCWQYNNSSRLLLGSSAKLGKDIIYMQQLASVPYGSWKLATKYSILVKQYALSQEAFEYYQQMKKNSEQMGSFFDPQPMELGGNIYSLSTPSEPVIGFFSAGSVAEKRMFIHAGELESWGYRMICDLKEVSADSFAFYFAGRLTPIYQDFLTGNVYGLASVHCFDCSLRAIPVEPDFWE